jgi:AAA family ATP:ADP antiporter
MVATPTPISMGRKGPLDSVLSLFTEVRPGEGLTAILLAVNVFALLGSYYVLKTIREPLILVQGGAEIKSYSAAGQALLLLLVLPLYGALAAKVNRLRLIAGVTLFFMANLAVFYLLGQSGARVGVAFFIWVGIFNVFITAQFWAFANDIYSEEEGKRLFPIVAVGSNLGAWVGAMAAESLFRSLAPESAPYNMMLIAAAGLGLGVVVTWMVNRREATQPRNARVAEKPLGKEGGFKLVFSQRYLFLLALLILMLNLVNTIGEFILSKLATQEFARQTSDPNQMGAMIGQFYGNFFGWVNLLGFLFQVLLVSRIFKYIGVRGALFILPCIALGSYTAIAIMPLLAVLRIGKILENSTDYSINNTTRHALFLPTSREAKYKAKATIDTLFWRIGDMTQAAIVYAGTTWLAFSIRSFAMLNAVFVIGWLVLAAAIARENKKLSAETPVEKAA